MFTAKAILRGSRLWFLWYGENLFARIVQGCVGSKVQGFGMPVAYDHWMPLTLLFGIFVTQRGQTTVDVFLLHAGC